MSEERRFYDAVDEDTHPQAVRIPSRTTLASGVTTTLSIERCWEVAGTQRTVEQRLQRSHPDRQ
jgi:hypothetical protein